MDTFEDVFPIEIENITVSYVSLPEGMTMEIAIESFGGRGSNGSSLHRCDDGQTDTYSRRKQASQGPAIGFCWCSEYKWAW